MVNARAQHFPGRATLLFLSINVFLFWSKAILSREHDTATGFDELKVEARKS